MPPTATELAHLRAQFATLQEAMGDVRRALSDLRSTVQDAQLSTEAYAGALGGRLDAQVRLIRTIEHDHDGRLLDIDERMTRLEKLHDH